MLCEIAYASKREPKSVSLVGLSIGMVCKLVNEDGTTEFSITSWSDEGADFICIFPRPL